MVQKILKSLWMKGKSLKVFIFSMMEKVSIFIAPSNSLGSVQLIGIWCFLMSDLGRQVMTQNKLSIHVENGDIFQENHNTGGNFYNFLSTQQNDDAAFIAKKFSYPNTFETQISRFLQAFSIDDIEKYDLYLHKNSKYLFYHFNDYIKAYGNDK